MERTKSNAVGRPPLPEGMSRNQRIVTFLTRDEEKRLKDYADSKKLSVSAACHILILKGIDS
jgi:hypothetical protein